MESEESPKMLQFVPFCSSMDSGFWHRLTQLKLDLYGLDDKPVNIQGYYCNYDLDGLVPHLNVDYNALDKSFVTPNRGFKSHGKLKNTNTMEDFKNLDKKTFLEEQGLQIWDDITSGRAIEDPSLLSRFLLLTFADLKKYHYYSWFAFTALCVPNKVTLKNDVMPISQRFSPTQISSLIENFDKSSKMSAFLIKENENSLEVGNLKDFREIFDSGSKVLIGFCDPSTLDVYPGWPLRNILALIAHHWAVELNNEVEIVCFRDRHKDDVRHVQHSIVLHLTFPSIINSLENGFPKCVGWEKNEHKKLGPRMVNMSASMDPTKLAESAVDLNLKLMRWRLLPELDLDLIKNTKCLLLGSGTLGCNVARGLLGWGIRNITLVDNSTISYSNPVRQSLFVFEDCLNGGLPKAETAAQSLKQIFPGVNAVGINLSIPMPGHPVSENLFEQVKNDISMLERLISDHDVVFLLMDTRESRWLPTVIGTSKKKIVLSAALGFDTYLVVRHGVRSEFDSSTKEDSTKLLKIIPGNRLGCYFCNDVVAPGNSTQDRTLDQQCTVSRPGISMMTAALAVELLISILVHPNKGGAEAEANSKDDNFTRESTSILGLVPHQIRGFLSRFCNILPASQAFDKCTACCSKVIEAYEHDGFEFLINVFNTPSYLEKLTGLTEMYAQSEDAEMWDFSGDDEDDLV